MSAQDGPEDDLITQAREWLPQLRADLEREPEARHWDFVPRRMAQEVAMYDPARRAAINVVLGEWLIGPDTARVGTALLIVLDLNEVGAVPALERERDRLRNEARTVEDRNLLLAIENAIRALTKRQGDSGA